MNERTKELAEQTGIILNESQKIMLKKFDELTMLKKFDELILRECLKVGGQYDSGTHEVYIQILELNDN